MQRNFQILVLVPLLISLSSCNKSVDKPLTSGPTSTDGQGESILGPVGPQGLQGPKGDKGDPGTLPPNVVLLDNNGVLPPADGSLLVNLGVGSFNARLSLSATDPIPTSNLTGGVLYLHAYDGNRILLWNGVAWIPVFIHSPVSVSIPQATHTNFDIFGTIGPTGVALETVLWSGPLTRTIGITYFNGVLVKSGDPRRRYLGTGRTTSSGLSEDGEKKRFLWNYYNRIPKKLARTDLGVYVSWNRVSTTSACFAAHDDASIRVELVTGWTNAFMSLSGSHVSAANLTSCRNANIAEDLPLPLAASYPTYNSYTGISDLFGYGGVNNWTQLTTQTQKTPIPGYHSYQLMECICGGIDVTYTFGITDGFGLVGNVY